MKKKILVGLLILIPILIVTLVYLINSQSQPVFSEGPEADITTSVTEDTSDVITVTPTPIVAPDISELLVELESGDKSLEEERILLLTQEESALGYYSNLILAYRYDEEGRDASQFYNDALKIYQTNEVHFKLAEHLVKNEQIEEAENEYLKLLPEDGAFQALTAFKIKPLRIIEAYMGKKQWKAAEELLYPLIEESSDKSIDIELISCYAQVLAEQNELKRALPYYRQLYELDPSNTGIAWWYARCLESSGQSTSAAKIYTDIGEKGAYRCGIILQNQGRAMEAAEVLSSSNEAISVWRAARLWDVAGMTEKAIEAYSKTAEITSNYQDDAAFRAYVLSKRIGIDSTDTVVDVLSGHPAWMARIGKEPVMPAIIEIPYDTPDCLKLAKKYEEKGYLEAAAIEVAILSKNPDLEGKLALGDWYSEREEHNNAILWGIRSINDKPTRRGYELAYPQAFEELVLAASEENNLEPALLWAVIREESHFRHEVISWAGAMGLMQIMPSTGKDIATGLGLNIKDRDLLNPEINIEFGTFYIRLMLNIFGQDIDKATAAYNGGAGNVKSWSQSKIGTSKEDFPTAITFFETQEYITKVKNSYYIYKWLYGI